MQKLIAIIIGCLLAFNALSQRTNLKDSVIGLPMITGSYAFQIPGADMADRFGANSNIGIDFLYKSSNNWLFGADFHFMFGNDIDEDSILQNITTEDGGIIGQDGQFANVLLYERGFSTVLKAGKLFPIGVGNVNSGIVFTAGAGFMQHKIRIEVTGNTVPHLGDEMKKGYDRLTNGLALEQFFGFVYLGEKKLLNFYGGIEVMQGFTQSRRTYNYDTMRRDTEPRLDLLYGIRIGWIIPFHKRSGKFYYQ